MYSFQKNMLLYKFELKKKYNYQHVIQFLINKSNIEILNC